MNSPTALSFRRPEILAPAGDETMIRAAVENGADAVYFGLKTLNARIRAENFSLEDLPRVVGGMHERGVRAYITLNTLVFADELEEFARAILACSRAGADAVLVQDLGAALLASRLAPELPLHASTQTTLTCAESIAAAEALGLRFERVVAPRELSLDELRKLRRDAPGVEIETFVHGALCVAYSGQCLTSEALGGRSANRGECAQACRLPYDLIVDGAPKDVGDLRFVLSPKDLAAYEDVGRLVAEGIASLKIEGRLKSPEYVAATVAAYRKAVDEATAGMDATEAAPDADSARAPRDPKLDAATRERLEMTFSRGFTGGYLHDIDHRAVVEGRYPKKRGTFLGRVERVRADGPHPCVEVRLLANLKPGDGVVFDAGRPDAPEEGGRVFGLRMGKRAIEAFDATRGEAVVAIAFGRGRIDLARVRKGDRVWKTSDPAIDAELRASFEGAKSRFRSGVRAAVAGRAGEPLRLRLFDDAGNVAEVADVEPAEVALKRPLTREYLLDHLGRMGDTPFRLDALETEIEGDVIVPVSRLNEMRRRACADLLAARRSASTRRPEHARGAAGAIVELRAELLGVSDARRFARPAPPLATSALSVLCRTLEQVEAAASHGDVDTIYADLEDVRAQAEAGRIVRAARPSPDALPRFFPTTLQVVKPGEAPVARKPLEAEPDGVLARNLAAWRILREARPGLEIRGDFSLNVANELTAGLLRRAGFARLVPSFDLNADQLVALLRAFPDPQFFEIAIHQHMPMFHMEHCVFCRYLSEGKDHTDCGRPCESHTLELRDRLGYAHPVKADAGCRNTVFNAIAQSGSEYLGALLAAGARRFRIDLLNETAARTREAIDAYLPATRGKTDGRALWRKLNAASKLGVTRGSLDRER